ncbi:MAG: RDD family protein [Elusimicrobia bacterium]|nr:RDD family protein [Elusimicrobiota bacterium]
MDNFESRMPEQIQEQSSLQKESDASDIQPAGFNERFIAYTIDAFPFVLGYFISFSILVKNDSISYSFTNELMWWLLWIFFYIIYQTVFSSGGRATLGKRIMSIRVRDKSGIELSIPRAFMRAIGYFLSNFTLTLGYIIALFNPQKRALHDYMAGSRVVSIKQKSEFAQGFILVLSWGLMAALIGSWVNAYFLRVTPGEERQIARAKRAIYMIARLEEFHRRKWGKYTDDLKRIASLTGNVPKFRDELVESIEPDSLTISSDGKAYKISAKARNWRKTTVEIVSKPN